MHDYSTMKKCLLQHGINVDNYFEYNNRKYSINDIFNEFHLLPIHLENYNRIYYMEDYYRDKLDRLNEFKYAFKCMYGDHMYSYINLYFDYLNSVYNIRFL